MKDQTPDREPREPARTSHPAKRQRAIVKCRDFRCMAYRDPPDTTWRNSFSNQPLPEPVVVLNLLP